MTLARPAPTSAPPPSSFNVFVMAAQVGLFSLGGGMTAWLHREVVIKRGWLDEDAFHTDMAAARILPGTNVSNFLVIAGYRLAGLKGATAGLLGILICPFVTIICLAMLQERLNNVIVQQALMGAAAAAVGFMVPMVVHSARQIGRHWTAVLVIGVVTLTVGVLAAPMLAVILLMLPCSVALTAWRRRSE